MPERRRSLADAYLDAREDQERSKAEHAARLPRSQGLQSFVAPGESARRLAVDTGRALSRIPSDVVSWINRESIATPSYLRNRRARPEPDPNEIVVTARLTPEERQRNLRARHAEEGRRFVRETIPGSARAGLDILSNELDPYADVKRQARGEPYQPTVLQELTGIPSIARNVVGGYEAERRGEREEGGRQGVEALGNTALSAWLLSGMGRRAAAKVIPRERARFELGAPASAETLAAAQRARFAARREALSNLRGQQPPRGSVSFAGEAAPRLGAQSPVREGTAEPDGMLGAAWERIKRETNNFEGDDLDKYLEALESQRARRPVDVIPTRPRTQERPLTRADWAAMEQTGYSPGLEAARRRLVASQRDVGRSTLPLSSNPRSPSVRLENRNDLIRNVGRPQDLPQARSRNAISPEQLAQMLRERGVLSTAGGAIAGGALGLAAAGDAQAQEPPELADVRRDIQALKNEGAVIDRASNERGDTEESREVIKAGQRILRRRGVYDGPIDGVWLGRTQAGNKEYEPQRLANLQRLEERAAVLATQPTEERLRLQHNLPTYALIGGGLLGHLIHYPGQWINRGANALRNRGMARAARSGDPAQFNRIWQRGGAKPERLPYNLNQAGQFTPNRNVAPEGSLFQPKTPLSPYVSEFDAALGTLALGEIGLTGGIALPRKEQELREAQELAEREKTEENLQRVRDLEWDVARMRAAPLAGIGFLGGQLGRAGASRLIGHQTYRRPSPDLDVLQRERSALNRRVRADVQAQRQLARAQTQANAQARAQSQAAKAQAQASRTQAQADLASARSQAAQAQAARAQAQLERARLRARERAAREKKKRGRPSTPPGDQR